MASSNDPIDQTAEALRVRRLDPGLRTVVIGAIGMAVPVWETAFNLGAYGTVFYERLFWLWVLSTTTVLVLALVQRGDSPIPRLGLAVMALPTIVILLDLGRQALPESEVAEWGLVILGALSIVIALPYTAYVISEIIDEELLDVSSARTLGALAGIVLFIGAAGLTAGLRNDLLLTCEDFEIAGSAVPDNCNDAPSDLIIR